MTLYLGLGSIFSCVYVVGMIAILRLWRDVRLTGIELTIELLTATLRPGGNRLVELYSFTTDSETERHV